jgi:SAM-dependent methyltransferase
LKKDTGEEIWRSEIKGAGGAGYSSPMAVDLVVMTGNVAQVFVDDDAWHATLQSSYEALRPDGRLVFEVRDPAFRGWEEWTPDASLSTTDTVHGPVESWVQLTRVDLPLVSFRWTFRFLDDGITLASDSTLRFRSEAEIVASLRAEQFVVEDVREAPDRPGRELVFIARRAGRTVSAAQARPVGETPVPAGG